eukprot:5883344-Pyramimonas_sp.AAC.1
MADPIVQEVAAEVMGRFEPLKALTLRVLRSERARALSMRAAEVGMLGPCGPLIAHAIRSVAPWGKRLLMAPRDEAPEALEALKALLLRHKRLEVVLVVLM